MWQICRTLVFGLTIGNPPTIVHAHTFHKITLGEYPGAIRQDRAREMHITDVDFPYMLSPRNIPAYTCCLAGNFPTFFRTQALCTHLTTLRCAKLRQGS